jgi:ubiquitin C-terminal hydrolase
MALLSKLASADAESTAALLFAEESLLADVLLQMDDPTIRLLAHVFALLPQKERAFAFCTRFISQINAHPSICRSFFSIFDEIVTEACDVRETVALALAKLPTAGQPYRTGLCSLLSLIFTRKPSEIAAHVTCVDVLVPAVVAELDTRCQSVMLDILGALSRSRRELGRAISEMLVAPFSVVPKRWNFDSSLLKKETPFTGLRNLGATCYLNSVVQQLFANSDLRMRVARCRPESEWLAEFQGIFARLQLSMLPHVETSAFCQRYSFNGMPRIDTREQQDASEFYQALLDGLGADVNGRYRGKMVNTIEGVSEAFTSENHEEFFMLSVPVKGCPDLQSALDRLIEDERIISPYFAESLGRKIDARKRARIAELPDFLVIHLKRFEYDLETWRRYKVNNRFELPEEFNFAPYAAQADGGDQSYRLTGVIVHDGHAEGGHYYSLVRVDGRWFSFNDTEVTEFSPAHFETTVYGNSADEMAIGPSAYLLFYTRIGIEVGFTVPDTTLAEAIPAALREAIDRENQLYVHDEAVFSLPITRFVLRYVSDLRVLLLYYTNVLLHSKNSTWASFTIDRIVSGLRTRDTVDFVVEFMADNISSAFDAFKFCANEEILLSFSTFLCDLLPKSTSTATITIIEHFIDHIVEIPVSSPKLSHAIAPIREFMQSFDLEPAIAAEWAGKIVAFVHSALETKRSAAALHGLVIGPLFDALTELAPAVTADHFALLMGHIEDFLVSPVNSTPFMRFVDSAINRQLTSLSKVTETVFGSESEFADEIKANFISAQLSSAAQQDLLRQKFAQLCAIATEETVLRALFRVIDVDVNLRVTLLTNPDVLLCPMVVFARPSVRGIAEQLTYELFPTLVSPHPEHSAEVLLEERPPQPRADADRDIAKDILVDATDAPTFTRLADDFAAFCARVAEQLPAHVGASAEPRQALTSLFRVMRWLCVRSASVSPGFVEGVWQLFAALGASEWRGGCNLCEGLRCVVALPRDARARLLADPALAAALFPLDFEADVRLNATIFLEALTYAGAHFPAMRDGAAFRESFRNFWTVPIYDDRQSWIIPKLADLGSVAQVSAAVLALLDVFEGDCPPVTVLPVVLDGAIPAGALVPVCRTAVMLCEMACADSAALELVLDVCGAPMFEALGRAVGENAAAAAVCAAAVPSLCAVFRAPAAAAYRQQAADFLAGLVGAAPQTAAAVADGVPAPKEAAGDAELAWASLSVRLACAVRSDASEQPMRQCLADAAQIVPESGGAYGSAFVDQLIALMGEEVLSAHMDAVRRLLSGFEAAAPEPVAAKIRRPESGLDFVRECGMQA